jgi:hypothetical protein
MAGKVVVSTLNNDTGVLATQNGMTGIPKAWGYFKFVSPGSAPTNQASFNVSSITRNAQGLYTVNFTTSMPTANYAVVITGNYNIASDAILGFVDGDTLTTSSFQLRVGYANVGNLVLYDYGFQIAILSS